jgi:hypothetical protein
VAVLRFKAVLLLLTGVFVISGPVYALQAYFQHKPITPVEEIPEKKSIPQNTGAEDPGK